MRCRGSGLSTWPTRSSGWEASAPAASSSCLLDDQNAPLFLQVKQANGPFWDAILGDQPESSTRQRIAPVNASCKSATDIFPRIEQRHGHQLLRLATP